MCDRNMNGVGVNPHINLTNYLGRLYEYISIMFVKQLDTMYMCGNLGDPIVAKDTLEISQIFRRAQS